MQVFFAIESEMIFLPYFRDTLLNTYGHVNGWAPFLLVTQSGHHRNTIKCTKIVPSDPKLKDLE